MHDHALLHSPALLEMKQGILLSYQEDCKTLFLKLLLLQDVQFLFPTLGGPSDLQIAECV